ncbi:MAG: phage holin family protein [Roseateles sp.]|uniref:phage holin family protein n=1 Tax=Roseateles sp. TaxID=1971397 RepID=UPI00403722D6
MADRPAREGPPPGTPGPDAYPVPASLLAQLQALWRELPGLVSDRVELLSLELKRAVRALAQIVALLVAVGILGVTAWLLLWAGVIRLLVDAGLPMAGALLLSVVVNVLAVVLVLQRVRSLLPKLSLPATRRHLMITPDPAPPKPPEEGNDERNAAPMAGQPVAR